MDLRFIAFLLYTPYIKLLITCCSLMERYSISIILITL